MGYAHNNTQIKAEPELKKSDDPLDQSYIGLEEFADSFLDSFTDFDGWVEDDLNPSMAYVTNNSDEKPNLEILDQSLEIKKHMQEEGFGPVKLGDLGSLMPNSTESPKKPNSEILHKSLETKEGNREEGCGPVKLGDSGSLMAAVTEILEKQNSEILDKSLETKGNEKEGGGFAKMGDLGSLIEEGMGRVSLTPNTNTIAGDGDVKQSGKIRDATSDEVEITHVETKKAGGNEGFSGVENGANNGAEAEAEESESESESEESESESESSSSSSSSSDDDDDEGERKSGAKGEVEMEEGEIKDTDVEEMIGWSDEEEDGNVVKGPIRSMNEVQNLPPVPPVDTTLEPHHQTLSVGVVLSIIGAQVVVEGVEKHNPLSEGSILWITENRAPLGVVDEIFGPVKNPYYIVRYNSESEVPTGIQQGSPISFVPEFADYVLNNNSLYKKGYDASGENDEELSDELEFSDDEKEAEYKRMLKMSKRGSNEQKNRKENKGKKSRNRPGSWKNDGPFALDGPTSGPGTSGPQAPNFTGPGTGPTFSPGSQAHNFTGPGPGPTFSLGSQAQNFTGPMGGPGPSGPQTANFTGLMNGPGMGLMFSPGPQAPNFTGPPSSGVWTTNGFVSIPPQNMGFPPNGFRPFMPQNFAPQPFQPNSAPFHPQFNTSGPMMPLNFLPQGGAGPTFAPWPAGMAQNGFTGHPQAGPPMAFQGMFSNPNALPMQYNGGGPRPPMSSNGGVRPPPPPPVGGNGGEPPRQSPNSSSGSQGRGGKPPFQRGGGRFRGGGGSRRGRGRGRQSR